ALIGIPVIHSLHTHVAEDTRRDGYLQANTHDSGDEQACDLCASYAHFVPREAGPISSFNFDAPVTLLSAIFVPSTCKQPCKGLLQGYTNRGPPKNLYS